MTETLVVPIWLIILLTLVIWAIGFVVGVIRTYAKTVRLGDLHMIFEDGNPDPYLFVELTKPLDEYGESLSDGVEVLVTIRRKNTP